MTRFGWTFVRRLVGGGRGRRFRSIGGPGLEQVECGLREVEVRIDKVIGIGIEGVERRSSGSRIHSRSMHYTSFRSS
jgi:hypothetical protein